MKNNNKYIGGLSLFIIAIIGYYVGVKPITADVQALEQTRNSAENERNTIQNELAEYKLLEAELENSSEVQRSRSLNSIPEKLNQDLIINTIVEKTDEHNMSIGSISFSEGAQTDLGVRAATITLSLQGDYQRLVEFLRSLENEVQRKMIIRNISVELGDSLGALQEISFSISMEVYYQN